MQKKNLQKIPIKIITKIAVLSAIATVLMLIEFPLWFAPEFYKLDLSEIVVLIGAFALGPLAGACIELIKVALNLLINGTITGGVGELANFIIGCSFVLPAALIYRSRKKISFALLGMAAGTVVLTLTGGLLNYYLLLPLYAKVYGAPIEALVQMGTAINPSVTDLKSFVFLAVMPFNLIKGVVSSLITLLLYKRLSPILHK